MGKQDPFISLGQCYFRECECLLWEAALIERVYFSKNLIFCSEMSKICVRNSSSASPIN